MSLHRNNTNPHRPFVTQEDDPGDIGAHKGWLKPSTMVWRVRNSANDGWNEAVSLTSIRTETTDEYTPGEGDEGVHIRISDPLGSTVLIPADATYDFAIGTKIWIEQVDDGPVLIDAEGAEPTINSRDNRDILMGKYSVVTLVKVGENEWVLYGDLTDQES